MPKGLYPLLTELSAIRHKQMMEYDSKKYRKQGEKNKTANISFIIKLYNVSCFSYSFLMILYMLLMCLIEIWQGKPKFRGYLLLLCVPFYK